MGVPFVLLGCADTLHLLAFGSHMYIGAVAAIAATDPGEAQEFFRFYSRSMDFTLVIASIGVASLFFSAPNGGTVVRGWKRKMAFILIAIFFIDSSARGATYNAYPAKVVRAYLSYLRERSISDRLFSSRCNFRYGAKPDRRIDEPIVCVLIIGESVRRDHMSLYGYDRQTTPRLDALSRLIFFTNAISPATQTQSSLRAVLSPADSKNMDIFYKTRSIVSLANEAGYDTYWISNQGRYGKHDTEVTTIALEARHQVFLNTETDTKSLDERLIHPVKRCLSDLRKGKFVVVHMLGSHANYEERYPPRFRLFAGSLKVFDRGKDVSKKISQYDNSIAYSDFVISEIIRSVKDLHRTACVIYVSDHGECLDDDHDGRFGHGFEMPHRSEVEVPLVFWCSEKFRERFPGKIANLKSHKETPIDTQDLFFSISDLLNASFADMDVKRDFVSMSYSPEVPRTVYAPGGNLVVYENLRLPSHSPRW